MLKQFIFLLTLSLVIGCTDYDSNLSEPTIQSDYIGHTRSQLEYWAQGSTSVESKEKYISYLTDGGCIVFYFMTRDTIRTVRYAISTCSNETAEEITAIFSALRKKEGYTVRGKEYKSGTLFSVIHYHPTKEFKCTFLVTKKRHRGLPVTEVYLEFTEG